MGPPHGEGYTYIINGDTIINTLTFHKLYIPYVDIVLDTMGTLHQPGYQGCIRHDSLSRKVYYIEPGDTNERILYDFNLNVGDAYSGYMRCFLYSNDTVQIVDSVLIGNSYRKHWTIGQVMNPLFGYSVIEGIGYEGGLLESTAGYILDGPRINLNCFSEDNQTLYPDTSFPCIIINAVKPFSPGNILASISPNPFHSSSLLQVSPGFEKAQMKIFNSLGLPVREETILNQRTFTLYRNELSNGIYFLQLINDSGEMITGKLIVE